MSWFIEARRLAVAIESTPELRFPPDVSHLMRIEAYQRFEKAVLSPLLEQWDDLGIDKTLDEVRAFLREFDWLERATHPRLSDLVCLLPTVVVGTRIVARKIEDGDEIRRLLEVPPFGSDSEIPAYVWTARLVAVSGEESVGPSPVKVLEDLEISPDAIRPPCLQRSILGEIPDFPQTKRSKGQGWTHTTLLRIKLDDVGLRSEFLEEGLETCIPKFYLNGETCGEVISRGLTDLVSRIGERVTSLIEMHGGET